jgi:hypothetical protein
MEYQDQPLNTICTDPFPTHIFFAYKLNLTLSKRLCQKLKSEMPVVNSLELQEELNKESVSTGKGFSLKCRGPYKPFKEYFSDRYWSGWHDTEQEGNYTNIYTGEPLQSDFRPFAAGEPNGGNIENCIEVWKKYGWNDLPCSSQINTFCYMKAQPRFIMRGEVTIT